MTLKPENKFNWSVTQAGKTQAFDGDFTYGGTTLTLVQSAGPAMVGKLTWSDPSHFAFKIVGGPPTDPGSELRTLRISRVAADLILSPPTYLA